jgi:uncharacterized protein (TIGR02145 family)
VFLTRWLPNNYERSNLRWEITNTNIARKWPCPTGYHVPNISEWRGLLVEGKNLGYWWGDTLISFWTEVGLSRDSNNFFKFQTKTLLPITSQRYVDGTPQNAFNGEWLYRTSADVGNYANIFALFDKGDSKWASTVALSQYTRGHPVRCFKN